ncbi:hypothetical protein BCR37DRAFT_377723 [Protomyces lactucae-debilis]|uniref:Uncharacterized protein n=1 Tax=Protomyces lactucae-debilis TaxID=2754530 RepID=A0A1Y2FLP6_PROLT|nr:uncharacterized protein BCR37DRAFT_377723 [Protomyces lactucae-debilis]ORY84893.1 hypothetical protein BCR37DRAFT_377723 [Protomyces lactucae-debilis]
MSQNRRSTADQPLSGTFCASIAVVMEALLRSLDVIMYCNWDYLSGLERAIGLYRGEQRRRKRFTAC